LRRTESNPSTDLLNLNKWANGKWVSEIRLLFDYCKQVRAGGGEAEEAVVDGVAGRVERLVKVGEEVALLRFAGLGGVGGEVGR